MAVVHQVLAEHRAAFLFAVAHQGHQWFALLVTFAGAVLALVAFVFAMNPYGNLPDTVLRGHVMTDKPLATTAADAMPC